MFYDLTNKFFMLFNMQIQAVVDFISEFIETHTFPHSASKIFFGLVILYVAMIVIMTIWEDIELKLFSDRSLEEALDEEKISQKHTNSFQSGCSVEIKNNLPGKIFQNIILNADYRNDKFGDKINHIVVNSKGIFVVECVCWKHYKILGEVYDESLSLRDPSANYTKVKNPYVTNMLHIKEIKKVFTKCNEIPDAPIFNVWICEGELELTNNGETAGKFFYSEDERRILIFSTATSISKEMKKLMKSLPDVLSKKDQKILCDFFTAHKASKQELKYRDNELLKKLLATCVYHWELVDDEPMLNALRKKAAEKGTEVYKL